MTMVHIIDIAVRHSVVRETKGPFPAGIGEASAPSGARVRIRAGGYLRPVRDGDPGGLRPEEEEWKGTGRGEL